MRFRTTRRALRADNDDGRGAPTLPLHEKDGSRVIQAHCGSGFRDADEKVGDDESRRGLEIEQGHNRKRSRGSSAGGRSYRWLRVRADVIKHHQQGMDATWMERRRPIYRGAPMPNAAALLQT